MRNLYDVTESILDTHDLGELTDDVKSAEVLYTLQSKPSLKKYKFIIDGDKIYWVPDMSISKRLAIDFNEIKKSDLDGHKICGACKVNGKKILPYNDVIRIDINSYKGKLSDIIHKDISDLIVFSFNNCQISDIGYLKCHSMEIASSDIDLSKINNSVKYISMESQIALDLIKKLCHASSVDFSAGDCDYIEIIR